MSRVKLILPLDQHDRSDFESVKIKLALVALPYGEGPQQVMPLGLQNISAYLKKHSPDIDAMIFDYSESSISDTDKLGDLTAWEPMMVGVSVYSSNVVAAKLWGNIVLSRLPDAFIFCGGPHISLAAESFLRYTADIYRVALQGEGEYSTLLLIQHITQQLIQKKTPFKSTYTRPCLPIKL